MPSRLATIQAMTKGRQISTCPTMRPASSGTGTTISASSREMLIKRWGTIMGSIVSDWTTPRPRCQQRTRPYAVMKPISVAATAATTASHRLKRNELTKRSDSTNLAYQRKEKPVGGKVFASVGLNEENTMIATGASRKT
jgi:hypothetical protein